MRRASLRAAQAATGRAGPRALRPRTGADSGLPVRRLGAMTRAAIRPDRSHGWRAAPLGLALLAGLALAAGLAPAACPGGPLAAVAPALTAPQPGLWLGSDDLGRSVGCLTAHGLRASLAVAFGTLALALALGLAVGLVAGRAGGATDAALMRLTAGFQVVPRFFLALLAVALFGASLPLIVLVLGATSWTLVARLARAEAMALTARPFVLAAEALGAPPGRVLLRHILPNALPPVRAVTPVIAGGAVMAEAGLGFLGLGAPGTVSLGRLVAEAYPFAALAPWMSLAPIAALVALMLALMAAAGALRLA